MTKEEWAELKYLVEKTVRDVLAEYGRQEPARYPNLASEAACQVIARSTRVLFENRAIKAGLAPK